MKITECEIGYEEETYHTRFDMKIYSETSNEEHSLTLILDAEDKQVNYYECTCKANTISKSLGNGPKECKHIKKAISVIKSMGYLE